jgi:hypothetical protein
MSIELSQVKEAYKKLRTYSYYDNTDILLRRRIVEFETSTSKDVFKTISFYADKPYDKIKDKKNKVSVEQKLEMLSEAINEYHKNPEFMDYFLDAISVSIYPKKIAQKKLEKNFITNRRIKDHYDIERVTAFIDAPIELHIVSVLWIMQVGVSIDAKLSDACVGNRLILNQNKDDIVQGSSLFKPYYKQYQKWRDESVSIAQNFIKRGQDVLFLNLDIQDYFHSVRIPSNSLFNGKQSRYKPLQGEQNLKNLFLQIHTRYTLKVARDYAIPYDFYEILKKHPTTNALEEVILPIGLLSSYVLANNFLSDFDNRILHKVKPAYYGRYVDDILIVIVNPKENYNDTESLNELKFSFEEYKKTVGSNPSIEEGVSFNESDLTSLENYVISNFYPILKLIDAPEFTRYDSDTSNRIFKINGYDSLYCQTEKCFVYYFDSEESDLVMDKLKKELNDRTSEFRDFPDEGEDNETFEESAYHLLYDGSEGKIKTLKDYKENRYGLTVFLANKIFSALRHEKIVTEDETIRVLKFFLGLNALEFHRLWEKIFTFFLANQQPRSYVDFYLHCLDEIEKINSIPERGKFSADRLKETLIEYLDTANEISLSLNPLFIKITKEHAQHFDFQLKKRETNLPIFFRLGFEFTKSGSYWLLRFRETNMLRQHYLIHPLLSFTKLSKNTFHNLSQINFPTGKYELDDGLLDNSPRPVKFWECCLAIIFESLSKHKREECTIENDRIIIKRLGIETVIEKNVFEEETKEDKFYLDEAFDLYKRINAPHIPYYRLEDEDLKSNFYKINPEYPKYDHIKPIRIQEICINNSSEKKVSNPSIAFANTEVKETNIVRGLRGEPNLSLQRYQTISSILKKARKEKCDILLFPEFFIPVDLVSSVVRYAEKNQVLTITGLEHLVVDKTAFNYLVTILPVEVDGIKDAIVIFRLKNHCAPVEELLITGNYMNVPKPAQYRYDLFSWRNIYFSTFYCFELSDVFHRSLFKGKIDLLVGVEWNKDTPYFSNIIESTSRDLHCYVAQVNTSQFGDTRLTQPVETAKKDILKLKGGHNDTILVADINISELREFQRQKFSLTNNAKNYKPIPPDFSVEDVLNRINNKDVLQKSK